MSRPWSTRDSRWRTRFDAVVVGLHRDFDYDRLAVAAGACATVPA
jgi:hypothetical protein